MNQTIKVTFPKRIPPERVKLIIEGNMKANSKFTCIVTQIEDDEDEENVFEISSSDPVGVFYFIGMTASQLLRKYERNS